MRITTLDNKTALIIGNNFTGTEGNVRSTLQCHVRRLRELQQCLNCLQRGEDLTIKDECHTSACNECLSSKAVCEAYKSAGFTHWCPALRRCDRCLEKELPCNSAVCFNITTDCQSKLKTALELLQAEQNDRISDPYSILAIPNPDIVHTGKNVHRSHCNWFMFIENARFCLVMLQMARLYSSCSEELKAVVTCCFERDRMECGRM